MNSLNLSLHKAATAIRRAKSIAIFAHMNPDGDTIGCQLGLGIALQSMGKQVSLLCHDALPTRFGYLPMSELVTSKAPKKVDLAIAVDCGSLRQLGSLAPFFSKTPQTLRIDHHDHGESFAKMEVMECEASAVGEIVYELLAELGISYDKHIASCLLTSIIVDTGAFRFSNIRPKTFEICSHLIKTGVDLPALAELAYWNRTPTMTRLGGFCLSRYKLSKNGKIAWAFVTQKDFLRFNAALADADPIADDLRSIEGVEIAALFRQTPQGNWRVSLRSKNNINVAVVAQLFGGGGHSNSAGCSFPASRPKDKDRMLKELQKLINMVL